MIILIKCNLFKVFTLYGMLRDFALRAHTQYDGIVVKVSYTSMLPNYTLLNGCLPLFTVNTMMSLSSQGNLQLYLLD